jgi:hypothetical protein
MICNEITIYSQLLHFSLLYIGFLWSSHSLLLRHIYMFDTFADMNSLHINLRFFCSYLLQREIKSRVVFSLTLSFCFILFLLLCWVGIHGGIYKGSYNISNISYLNSPLHHCCRTKSLQVKSITNLAWWV